MLFDTVEDIRKNMEQNKDITFDEYEAIQRPSVAPIINDYAVELMKKDSTLTLEQAIEKAEKRIDVTKVPELIQHLRCLCNSEGFNTIYSENICNSLDSLMVIANNISNILSVVYAKEIQDFNEKHRQEEDKECK